MFDIIIGNLDAGSYLCMMPKNILQSQIRIRRIYTFIIDWSVDIL